jgi:predicted metal-dependent hydrolase
LKLVDQAQTPLRLHQGRFEPVRSQQDQGRDLFIQWYRQHLKPYLEAIANPLLPRVGAEPATVQVRELGNRWGSCSPKGDLYFHWRVALLPRAMIEYVVIHEMVHLVEPHHNTAFWERVGRILPNWQERKDWLARNGATYDL